MKPDAAALQTGKGTLAVGNSLDLPELPQGHPLTRVLSNALAQLSIPLRARSDTSLPYWGVEHFGFEKVSIFRESTEEEQQQILYLSSKSLLEESSCIEASATCFTAKMALLSESFEERMFYSLMAAEEVGHFHALQTYLAVPLSIESKQHPFVKLLNEAVEGGDRLSLIYIIQVVLEGWGLTHFRDLAEGCLQQDLNATLSHMLKDEARHHGSGVVLFRGAKPDSRQQRYMQEVLIRFLAMIQVGPLGLLDALEQVKGHLSKIQKITILEQLNSQQVTKRKLDTLRELMHRQESEGLVAFLDNARCFDPLPAVQAVERTT